jgi:uncharacterized protein (DUF433 family)
MPMRYDTISPPPLVVEPVDPEHLAGDLVEPGDALFGLVWINPDRLGGVPCFYGSRVPIISLFYYLGDGDTLDGFLQEFPGVRREQALGVLDLAVRGLIRDLDRYAGIARPQSAAHAAAALATA